jgi:hypothetical protein
MKRLLMILTALLLLLAFAVPMPVLAADPVYNIIVEARDYENLSPPTFFSGAINVQWSKTPDGTSGSGIAPFTIQTSGSTGTLTAPRIYKDVNSLKFYSLRGWRYGNWETSPTAGWESSPTDIYTLDPLTLTFGEHDKRVVALYDRIASLTSWDPIIDCNQVGVNHTLKVKLPDNVYNKGNIKVFFARQVPGPTSEVGTPPAPTVSTSDQQFGPQPTDAGGWASMTYTTASPRIDLIYAYIDVNSTSPGTEKCDSGEPISTQAAVKYWVNMGPISPPGSDINPVGITHTVWENIGLTVSGIKVMFTITGANSAASGFAVTDSTGKATFTYTGVNEGVDSIFSYIDVNKNGSWDSGEPKSPNTTMKFWVKNFVTGGGNIKDSKKVIWTFDGIVGVNPEGGAIGSLHLEDKVTKQTYDLNQFSGLSFSGPPTDSPSATHNTARFRGTGTRGDGIGVMMVIMMQDNGEPGKDVDKIAVELVSVNGIINPVGLIGSIDVPDKPLNNPGFPTPPLTLVTISGGNFQVHDLP